MKPSNVGTLDSYIRVIVNYIEAMLNLAHRHRYKRHLEDQDTLLQ